MEARLSKSAFRWVVITSIILKGPRVQGFKGPRDKENFSCILQYRYTKIFSALRMQESLIP
jgi:hypothetical protein